MTERGVVVELAVARVVTEVADDPSRLPRLWSERALAERLDVSRGTIRNLWRSGRLRGFRLDTGGAEERQPLRFDERDVLALLREVRR